MIVYVEENKNLSYSIPSLENEYLEKHYKYYNSKGVFDQKNGITEDMNFTVKVFCDDMDKDTCKRFRKDCMLLGHDCKGKRLVILVIVVCSVAALACIGAVAFVIVTKFFSKTGYNPIDIGLLRTVIIPINGIETSLLLDVDEIGRGRYGIVFHAESKKDDSQYAVKVIQTTNMQEHDKVDKEVKVMEELDTQFVVAVYGSVRTDVALAIAMEYMPLGSLQNVLQQDKLPSNGRVPMLLDIAKAMTYIHSIPIIHRDLKPGNVLVCSLDTHVHPMCKFVFFLSRPSTNDEHK